MPSYIYNVQWSRRYSNVYHRKLLRLYCTRYTKHFEISSEHGCHDRIDQIRNHSMFRTMFLQAFLQWVLSRAAIYAHETDFIPLCPCRSFSFPRFFLLFISSHFPRLSAKLCRHRRINASLRFVRSEGSN